MNFPGSGEDLLRSFLNETPVTLEELQQALVHPSSTAAVRMAGVSEFQRLEFLGDAALGMAVALVLYERLPEAGEGTLTRIRSSVVRGSNLALMARWLGIQPWIVVGDGEDVNNESILADSCEVLFGLLALRCGVEAVGALIHEIFTATDWQEVEPVLHPKTELKEYAERLQQSWSFREVSREGPEHEPVFTCEARLGDLTVQAVGGSHKAAETEAARLLLEHLRGANDG